jgi:ribonuclease R
VVDMYRAFLMRDHVGEEYDGKVAGVASFGLFVQIDAPFVEGLVKAATLGDDHYVFDEETMRLTGSRSGRSFKLGDAVRVRIENVSVPRRKIDLALVEHTAVPIIEIDAALRDRIRKRPDVKKKEPRPERREGTKRPAKRKGDRDVKPKRRGGPRRRR